MTDKLPLEPGEGNRFKIQDIIPRKDRKGSLLAKIMGPRFVAPPLEKDAQNSLLRSLPFGRGENKRAEKVIRLKKRIFQNDALSLVKKEPPKEEKKFVVSRKNASKQSLFLEGVRKKIETATVIETVPTRSFHGTRRIILLLGSAVIAVAFLLLSFVFAKATVSFAPSFAELSLDGVRISAEAKVTEEDVAGKKIPAFLLETTDSVKQEFSASAKERVSRRASGAVRIYNAFGSLPQTLVAQTRFQDSSGRIFRLKQRVTVPGAKIQNGAMVPSSIPATVEAEKPGEEFNVSPGRFTIPGFLGSPKFKGFYAESTNGFTGGFVGDALVVRQADITAASEEVTAALFANLKEGLERKIPSGAAAIQGAREIMVTTLRKPNAGEMRDRFTVEADGKASVMLFRMDDIFSLLEKLALAPDAEKKVSREKSRLEFDRISLSVKDRVLAFDIRGSLAVFSVLAPEKMREIVRGKSLGDVENILRADPRIRAFGIKIFPSWRNTIPSDENKIRVLIQE